MRFVDYGLSSLARTVVEHHVAPDVEYDLASLYSMLSREGQLGGLEVTTRFYEIGSPNGLHALEVHLSSYPRSEPD